MQFFSELRVAEKHRKIAEPILKEVRARLGFLEAVGLDYLTLNRSARTTQAGKRNKFAWPRRLGLP